MEAIYSIAPGLQSRNGRTVGGQFPDSPQKPADVVSKVPAGSDLEACSFFVRNCLTLGSDSCLAQSGRPPRWRWPLHSGLRSCHRCRPKAPGVRSPRSNLRAVAQDLRRYPEAFSALETRYCFQNAKNKVKKRRGICRPPIPDETSPPSSLAWSRCTIRYKGRRCLALARRH